MRDNGALMCARYAFAPNYYHYCGPETQGELGEYVAAEEADRGLAGHLAKFETLYPYLKVIAAANGIADPLDRSVVEAYWVGNGLLEKVDEKATYAALTEYQNLDKRLPTKELKWLLPKIDRQARLHHSFHVLNVFTRTGHHTVKQTMETMDECRISWGRIRQLNSGSSHPARNWADDSIGLKSVPIDSQTLIYTDGKLRLVSAVREVVVAQESLAKKLKPGDWVSMHWGIVCDKLSEKSVKRLNFYTEQSLKLANETI